MRCMNSYQELESVTLGNSLRQLAEQVTKDADNIYSKFGFDIDPKWFPVFYVLASKGSDSVVNISREIGHSHVSVSKIVKEMSDSALITSRKAEDDSRVTLISLSVSAKKMIPAMELQCNAVKSAIAQLSMDTGIDLWEALKVSQRHLKYRPLSARIESLDDPQEFRIVDYAPKYQTAFKNINVDWISKHWELEEPDLKAIDNPDAYILDTGGAILMALHNNEPIGCCALIKIDTHNYELAKMAVYSTAQGKGVGLVLGKAILNRAKSFGARRVYLETNSILEPAINLYLKLGFQYTKGKVSPYERCNIQMETYLDYSFDAKQP